MKRPIRVALLLANLALSLVIGSEVYASPTPLRVWTPSIQSPWKHENTRELMATISAKTGKKVVTHASKSIQKIVNACIDHQVDHSILPVMYARQLLEYCDMEVIAEAAINISLFTTSPEPDIHRLEKIGFVSKTVSDRVARQELPVDQLSEKLVELSDNQHAISAFFRGDIDALIINDIVIDQLTAELKQRVTKVRTFENTGRVYFLVSKTLPPAIKNKLQSLYMSDDPVISKLFYDLAGLHRIEKPRSATSLPLRVWGPRVRENRPDAQLPLIARLEATTGRTISFNVSTDIDALLAACARQEVDHALLERETARAIIEQFGYIPIAHATIPISLYVRSTGAQELRALHRIAYLKRTSAYTIARTELPLADIEDRLIPFSAYHQAVFALLNGEVDALIANDRYIADLADNLQNKLRKRLQFLHMSEVYFLVSPQLDRNLAARLQQFYLSDDAVIEEMFYRRAGLNPIRAIALPETDEAAPKFRPHRGKPSGVPGK